MPLLANLRNPYIATLKVKQTLMMTSQADIDKVTTNMATAGHDGGSMTVR